MLRSYAGSYYAPYVGGYSVPYGMSYYRGGYGVAYPIPHPSVWGRGFTVEAPSRSTTPPVGGDWAPPPSYGPTFPISSSNPRLW